jgi:anti-sigma-K factor RskA
VNEKDFAELAGGHALNALSPDDERAFQSALAEHPEWAAQVDADLSAAAGLAGGVAEVAPPLTLRSELLSRIATLPQSGSADTVAAVPSAPPPLPEIPASVAAVLPPDAIALLPAEPGGERDAGSVPPLDTVAVQAITRRNWTRGLFALAASFVLLLGLGFGAVLIGDQLTRPTEISALDAIEASPDAQTAAVALDDGGVATAHWSAALGKAVLVSDGLPSIASDEAYEMWFIRGGTAMSAGVFTADAAGDATAVMGGEMKPGDIIAVTVEASGGAPDGKPTSDPIVRIPTA